MSAMKSAAGAILLMTFSMAPSVLAAQQYETYGTRRAADILPAELRSGPHFRVADQVVSYAYLHHYTVASDFGRFEVTGDGALRKLVREIWAIAALRNVDTAEAIAASAKQVAKAPFELARNLVTNPVDTISGLPKGVFQIFGNVAKGVTMKHDPAEDSRIEQALFVSSWKRDFAAQFGIDVYSSNKVLQKELNRVSWAAALTGLAISAALMPAGGAGITAVKNMRFANQIGNALKEEPPPRLRLINETKLKKLGIGDALVTRFLDHPSFTPRHDVIIAESLAQMVGTRGHDAFLSYILAAQDEVGANFFQQMAETMRGYHDTVSPLLEIRIVAGLVVALARNGSALIPFPLDHGVWRARAAQLFDYIRANYRPAGFNGKYDLWVTGTVSDMARQQLGARGVKIVENVDERIGFMY